MLVPCAVSNAIYSSLAGEINARIIIEGAHGPVSNRAAAILEERGVPVVPDILSNGGGVVVSYLEWVQNRTGFYWAQEVIDKRLNRLMREALGGHAARAGGPRHQPAHGGERIGRPACQRRRPLARDLRLRRRCASCGPLVAPTGPPWV